MARVRREVRTLGSGWSETLQWYATAVTTMQSRPLSDRTSWKFFAAMHGIHPVVWREFGFLEQGELGPPAVDQRRFWNQCQHQSWYFLPWHRGYLAAFEQVALKAVVDAGGPEDWALPYWNYSDAARPDARTLPEVFAERKLPEGGDNPLWVERRFGSGTPPIVIDEELVSLAALRDTDFAGGVGDIPPGFGGPHTLFHHGPESETTNGSLESTPHNVLHGAVGGSDPAMDPNDWRSFGLMSTPLTAALDPIFWLHHANIDRLWGTWRRTNADPADEGWLVGPADRPFVMPKVDGSDWPFTAQDVLDTSAAPLNYRYDDEVAPEEPIPVPEDRRVRRLAALGAAVPARPDVHALKGADMTSGHTPELIGSSEGSVHVTGETDAPVRLDKSRTNVLHRSLQRALRADAAEVEEPPRVFLKLENIRGTSDAALYYVYIDIPPGANRAEYADRLAGTVSLFGISAASDQNGPHAGSGINQVLEISQIVDALDLSGDELAAIDVRFVPANETTAAADFSIGRISVFMLE